MLPTPTCFSLALYASFVYGIIYANLAAFPIEFQEEPNWNLLVGALPFLGLLFGILLGGGEILQPRLREKRQEACARSPPAANDG